MDRLSFIPLFLPLQSADRWESYQGCNLSVWPHLIVMVRVKMTEYHVTLIFSTKLQKDSGHSQPLPYSPSWVVFRPNVLVDARTGDILV